MKTYEIENTSPTVQEFKYLCESVGWSDFMNFEVVEASLKNSIYCVTVKENEQMVGMGRIVGDGAIYFYIQDIVVHPTYQKNGIGKEIMNRLVDFLHSNAPDKAFIGLFASQGNESFYEKFDFKDYSPNMTGMFTVISKK
ncbi:GNAT family N-acetyltransferase [Peribacillus psychrosaccharolyticus]|uniref:GNAT family N-acetyltransferase n=1 Tax=Peribacillus psychrosaccharolyticus TaxID=1407 RepID=A0A974NP81_PERPY|nr:GNAT family N-acetyltransferase [Peribacillus psychrosaccharolyticus]MEC2054101.1 GNAT family N-acetyltransferase [Peribacillus psychrosaccharolyticus]MED3742278.1 GNAT family N-acetyltransferase [Peribacillus psychrosaccharolyticus]QQT01260.1 GNAT family N-acetyltransferase [Peribacillus psychrosaccharolyticus]